ncbi:MAG: rane protein [Segetibacter sp.]|nr:rane protein [Segetibacter sp.]
MYVEVISRRPGICGSVFTSTQITTCGNNYTGILIPDNIKRPRMKEYANNTSQHMARIVERNIDALLERQKVEESSKKFEEKIADTVTRFTGSMVFVYIHLVLFGIWITWNMGVFGLQPFDESLVILAMFASVEAIFLSTFVLISQNRMNEKADKRAELNLQISLLAEHEITRLITLNTAMAKQMGLEHSYDDEEIKELSKDIHPERVMDAMENIDLKKNEHRG